MSNPTKEPRIVVNIRLLESEVEMLDRLAEKDGRSRSSYMRRLILSALDAPINKTQPPRQEAKQ
ncbi:MAG: ribbon-helix-helix domain-containing protein [Alphaproteobacteria bacterium]|nr:ribbon-helix-helix domain-containing protein [Alphaproteobacteria bacterium]